MNTEYMIQQLKQYKKEQGKKTHQKMYDPCRRYHKGDIVRARL